jgi:hypothetical protein
MAKLLLREALQIRVNGKDNVVGYYGSGKQTYIYDVPGCKTNAEASHQAHRIHTTLNGGERQILEGPALPSDVPDDEGLIHV